MPTSKGTTEKNKLVQTAPKWMSQDDVLIDEPLAHPRLQLKDYAILAFLAWNFVLIGAVMAQWVADIVLELWFLTLLCFVNMGLWRLLGVEFLWSIFLKRDMRGLMKNIMWVFILWVGFGLVSWGGWAIVATFSDVTVLGHKSLPFPLMTATWQEVLYWIGLTLSMIIYAVVDSVWWHVLYDNACNVNWGMRGWAGLCVGCMAWCLFEPTDNGHWWWVWLLAAFLWWMASHMVSCVLYDMFSLAGPVGLRLGLMTFWFLMFANVRWQWWNLEAFSWQWSYVPQNLWTGVA
jgi:hypothetical protein